MVSAWHKLASAFYARVYQDPRLRPLFPGKSPHCAIEELAAFLAQYFGSSGDDTQRRWWLSLRESHLRFKIGPAERAAWMENMRAVLDQSDFEEPRRAELRAMFERASAYLAGGETTQASDAAWDAQLAVDQAVAAIGATDYDRAIYLIERSVRNRSILVGLLALMMRTRSAAFLHYVKTRIEADLSLIHERNAGRTLLHEAAACGNLEMVRLLLLHGADANVQTAGGHTPIYCLANQYGGQDGGSVVHALLQSGADVNACDGKSRTTALHMAARRGHLETAKALLLCGAKIDARDTKGDTPLRRALNCRKPALAALLREFKAGM